MSKNPLHVYRALLRECSYLPDPNARTFIKGWVSDSFRRYLPSDPGTNRCKPVVVTPQRESNVLRKGRHLANTLRRANEGYPTPFEKVLKWTYGRFGKRRRVMMANLAGQELNGEELPEPGNEHPKKFSPGWKEPPIVKALLQHQLHHQKYLLWESRKIRLGGPKIAETNIWGIPMPECRIRNKRKKWYATHLDQIFPPLPEGEVEEMKALATGTKKWDSPKPRRPMASVLVYSSPDVEFQSVLDEPKSRTPTKERPHNLTQRFFRRRMANILIHTPVARAPVRDPGRPVALKWERARNNQFSIGETNEMEANALFG
jgi:Complex 1 protein (LYR family)